MPSQNSRREEVLLTHSTDEGKLRVHIAGHKGVVLCVQARSPYVLIFLLKPMLILREKVCL